MCTDFQLFECKHFVYTTEIITRHHRGGKFRSYIIYGGMSCGMTALLSGMWGDFTDLGVALSVCVHNVYPTVFPCIQPVSACQGSLYITQNAGR